MNGLDWLIALFAAAGVALGAAAAAWLFAAAFTGRRPTLRRLAAAATTDECDTGKLSHGGRCACCSYDLAGLELGYCPECGWAYTAGPRLPWRKRFRAACHALFAAAFAFMSLLLPHASKHGIAHLAPSSVLAAALPVGPALGIAHPGVATELRSRLECRGLRHWECELLASSVATVLSVTAHQPGFEGCRLDMAAILNQLAGDGHVDPALLAGLMEDPSPRVRALASDALGRVARAGSQHHRVAAARWLMAAVMCDRDTDVRRHAVMALGAVAWKSPGAIGVLARAARDPAPRVRARAMYALSRCPGHTLSPDLALATLASAATDSDAGVREAAAMLFRQFIERLDAAFEPHV